jgi:hypothetical protein
MNPPQGGPPRGSLSPGLTVVDETLRSSPPAEEIPAHARPRGVGTGTEVAPPGGYAIPPTTVRDPGGLSPHPATVVGGAPYPPPPAYPSPYSPMPPYAADPRPFGIPPPPPPARARRGANRGPSLWLIGVASFFVIGGAVTAAVLLRQPSGDDGASPAVSLPTPTSPAPDVPSADPAPSADPPPLPLPTARPTTRPGLRPRPPNGPRHPGQLPPRNPQPRRPQPPPPQQQPQYY